MKDNINYYPRRADSHRHPKFRMLRSLFKDTNMAWAAEGRFWALNDMIAESNNCCLDLRLKRNMAICAGELNLSLTEFQEFIKILLSQDVELLYEIEKNVITTKKVQETFETITKNRSRANKNYKSKKNDNKYFHFVCNLYEKYTNIKPSEEIHINPLLKLFGTYAETLTDEDIEECIKSVFVKLKKGYVKMDYLMDNINKAIIKLNERRVNNNKEEYERKNKPLRLNEMVKDYIKQQKEKQNE